MATSKTSTPSATEKVHNGLITSPPMPRGLPEANLTDNAVRF
jgi:hypothetical protein